MHILTNIDSLKQFVDRYKIEKKRIGFVPTMGALHEGHLSLVRQAQQDCDIVVCSIFVNPTQFNNSKDLENYPITIEQDSKLLEEQACDILFLPSAKEMYPNGLTTNTYLLNGIDKMLEGRKRPGHFDGVCTIVHRLFSIVEPNAAFFGEKDFQQLAIIKQMVQSLSLPIDIKSGITIREKNGLAKSSRNKLLTASQQQKASQIYDSLIKVKSLYGQLDNEEIKEKIGLEINQTEEMKLDYIAIVKPHTFEPIIGKAQKQEARVLIAVFLGNVRLIDNLSLND
ncbi:pantoate--beta-alanine ligase [Flavobacteriales bacterium]|jgi:pantoate--beta-alanine ligase|nr:pantoate--beta-alanine ligase [Flavobacteriales bacterium]